MPTERRRLLQRIRQRKHREQERAEITAMKVNRGCVVCGISHPAVLQFHHKDRTTKVKNIALMISTNQPAAVIEAEIEKCEVLCMNCHTIKHYNDNLATDRADSGMMT